MTRDIGPFYDQDDCPDCPNWGMCPSCGGIPHAQLRDMIRKSERLASEPLSELRSPEGWQHAA